MKYLFNEPENLMVFTTKQIQNGASILHVIHDSDDGAWQFLGLETPDPKDGILYCLEDIVKIDETINEVADLPLGWHAWRRDIKSKWSREPRPKEWDERDKSEVA